MTKLRVAVIGAGAAGLCAARYLAAKPEVFQPVVFEQTGQVGGTWIYVEDTGRDDHGLRIHSSMYQSLKTNLPKEVMAFEDFPFRDDLPSFIGHADVREYLEDYTKNYDLMKYIQFWTSVESVSPLSTDDESEKGAQWVVAVKHLLHDQQSEKISFDAVMVCNGHYSVPHVPSIRGLASFTGDLSHSHNYRRPDRYKDKTVALIGAGQSGIDVALDVAKVAKKVFLCHWKARWGCKLPDNMDQALAVTSVRDGNVLVFEDGKEESVDAIVACTGYDYSFPFLSPECRVTVRNKHIRQLYMHCIHMAYPTMSFIGINYRICPFPQFVLQAKFFLGVLEGSVSLPSRREMEAEEESDLAEFLRNGHGERSYHLLDDRQWAYNDLLVARGALEPAAPYLEDLYNYVGDHRKNQVMDYKNMNFRLKDNWWERI